MHVHAHDHAMGGEESPKSQVILQHTVIHDTMYMNDIQSGLFSANCKSNLQRQVPPIINHITSDTITHSYTVSLIHTINHYSTTFQVNVSNACSKQKSNCMLRYQHNEHKHKYILK